MKITFLIALAVTLSLLAADCISPKKKYLNPNQVIGDLKWETTEAATKQTLDQGAMSVRVKDVRISKETSSGNAGKEIYFQKSISVSQKFFLSMHEFPETKESKKEGFGLTVNSLNPATFCWEWFDLDNENHATKLQESGELAIKMQKVGFGKEITKMEFLTDVTFRINVVPSDKPQDNPKWLVRILKGSWVNWPSLVGNTITPND